MQLNQVERDYIEFMAQRRGRPERDVEAAYRRTRKRFKLQGMGFRVLCDTMHHLYESVADDATDRDIVVAHQLHQYLHLLRFVSYSFPPKEDYLDHLRTALRMILDGQVRELIGGIRRKVTMHHHDETFGQTARHILETAGDSPRVLDYGCGLAYVSFEIGRQRPGATFQLLDVDCATLDFAEFRFAKHGMGVSTIRVTPDEIYPKLPPHDVCIATEVIEHVREPLTVYSNIYDALEPGGVLHGDFEDHGGEMFHVSPDLREVRARLDKEFEQIGETVYRKR